MDIRFPVEENTHIGHHIKRGCADHLFPCVMALVGFIVGVEWPDRETDKSI